MLGLSREHGAGGVFEEQESDKQVPACPGGGGHSQKSSLYQWRPDFYLRTAPKVIRGRMPFSDPLPDSAQSFVQRLCVTLVLFQSICVC